MSYVPRWHSLIAGLVAASTLVACGGGGGGTDAVATPVGVTPPANIPPTIVPDTAAPTATGSIAVDGRNWINYRRTQLGVPVVTENVLINNAALGHSEYLRTNSVMSHDQAAGKPGFTGVTLKDRLNAAGYTIPANGYAYGEVISGVTRGTGFFMAEELVTAIYHRFVMFEPKFREIGTGAATSSSGYSYFTADFASRGGFGPGSSPQTFGGTTTTTGGTTGGRPPRDRSTMIAIGLGAGSALALGVIVAIVLLVVFDNSATALPEAPAADGTVIAQVEAPAGTTGDLPAVDEHSAS